MLQNYSNLPKLAKLIIFPIWLFVSFYMSQALVTGLVWILVTLHIPLSSMNQAVLNSLFSALLYLITLAFVIGLPWLIKRSHISREDIGLTRLPSWTDIFITPAGLVVYFISSAVLILIATKLFPGFDVNQIQNTGFSQLNERYEYILAFATLVIIAPIAEEILFRGYLFGKLKKFAPVWVAIIITSVLFGLIHGAWNLAVDTFALSVILCLLREFTGNIWASILLHMAKNGIAFYFLFINPSLFTILSK